MTNDTGRCALLDADLDALAHRSPALLQLVRDVAAAPSLDAASLGAVLRARAIGFDDVRSFIRFDEVNYVRSLVFRCADFEVRLLCWRPGQGSALHGHGRSACALKVLRGTASEIVIGERDRVHAPGTVVEEIDPHRVHQVNNLGPDALLSLHIYAPPIPIDAPSDRRGHDVVVIGGGAAGAAVAYHLLKKGDRDLRVHLVEKGPWVGRGIAYAVESDVFVLNVPAARMSIDPEIPDDFVRYAGAEAHPHAFLPRALYGAYINDRLARMVRDRPGKLRIVRDEAVAVRAVVDDVNGPAGGVVELRSGKLLPGRAVVLATGLSSRVTERTHDPREVDAWDECMLGALPRDGRILLLGSGLSALDVVAWLDHAQFRGSIRIVSPRGLLPLPHREPHTSVTPMLPAVVDSAPAGLRARVAWVRGLLTEAEAAGEGFQAAMDRLRPHVERLYRSLAVDDRRRFLRHLRSYWDVLRHRAPVASLARVVRLQEAGRLQRTAGRVIVQDRSGPRIDVTVRTRGGALVHDSVDAIVRCIGPALSLRESATPLTESLLRAGLAVADSTRVGLTTDPAGALVQADGTSSRFLYGIGAVRRASSWETTAMPDISAHARAIARPCLLR